MKLYIVGNYIKGKLFKNEDDFKKNKIFAEIIDFKIIKDNKIIQDMSDSNSKKKYKIFIFPNNKYKKIIKYFGKIPYDFDYKKTMEVIKYINNNKEKKTTMKDYFYIRQC